LFPDGGLDGIGGNLESLGQYLSEAAVLFFSLLNENGLSEGVEVDQFPAKQKFSEVFPPTGRVGSNDLPVSKENLPFLSIGLKRQNSGFAAQTDDLEDFPQAQIF